MMNQKAPTELELYYDGSYVGKWGRIEIFRYQNDFYIMLPGIGKHPGKMTDDLFKTMNF